MSDVATNTRRERFLPYAYERFGLDFAIRACSLDDRSTIEDFDSEKRVVQLNDLEWERAELRVEVALGAGLPQRVLPAFEHKKLPVHVLVAVRCDRTRLRRGIELVPHADKQGLLEGIISLQRDDLRGHAELVPYLVRSENCARSAPGFAVVKGARLASAGPWEVRVDTKPLGAGQYLNIRFNSFKGDPRMQAGNLYWLDAEHENPTLWLNSDETSLAEVLASRGTRGGRARIRDVVFAMITMGVWTQLFMRAASNAQLEDGHAGYEWEENVLRLFLPEMFPEAQDHESRCLALRELYDEGGAVRVLEHLDTLLQRRQSLVKYLNGLLSELIQAET
jgi:hypothetical protein